MITLNLLPKEKKDGLKNAKAFKLAREAILLLFLFAATAAIMLLLSRYMLEQQLADLAERNATSIQSNEAINQKISQINSKISSADSIQKTFQPLSPIFLAAGELVVDNVRFEQVKFFRQQATLELSGTAKTRTDLSTLKKRLEETSWIKSFDLPLTSLIDKENNRFTIKVVIDPEKI